LCGFDKALEHLDGHEVKLVQLPGDVIKPGDVKMFSNEGMPIRYKEGMYGELVRIPLPLMFGCSRINSRQPVCDL
jgi:DnaJ-class molecular chaperone